MIPFWVVLVALGAPLLAVLAVLNVEDGSRATRWQFSRWVLIESFVVAAAASLALIRDMGGWVILLGLFATLIALRVQHLAAQRFQDLGQSKWWSLLLALPVINALVAVVLMVMTSKQTTAPALERGPLHGDIVVSPR
ncbi:MAG TPA: DUF805 domain-containing protein [Burkholderiaceae bacterium]|nr:DUF805 domain-containing protein [Burkholderiaceae bacterium]